MANSKVTGFLKGLLLRDTNIKEEIKELIFDWAEIRQMSDEIERRATLGSLKKNTMGGPNIVSLLQSRLDEMKETIGNVWKDDKEIQKHLKNALTIYEADFSATTDPGKEMKKDVELTEDIKGEITELIADWAKIRQIANEIERQANNNLLNRDSMKGENIVRQLKQYLDKMKRTIGKIWQDDKKIQKHLKNALTIYEADFSRV